MTSLALLGFMTIYWQIGQVDINTLLQNYLTHLN